MTKLKNRIVSRVSALLGREDGQTMAEYAIILAVVAVIASVAYLALGGTISKSIDNTGKQIPTTTTSTP
jgi:Flp pilus assembly pilin Flp